MSRGLGIDPSRPVSVPEKHVPHHLFEGLTIERDKPETPVPPSENLDVSFESILRKQAAENESLEAAESGEVIKDFILKTRQRVRIFRARINTALSQEESIDVIKRLKPFQIEVANQADILDPNLTEMIIAAAESIFPQIPEHVYPFATNLEREEVDAAMGIRAQVSRTVRLIDEHGLDLPAVWLLRKERKAEKDPTKHEILTQRIRLKDALANTKRIWNKLSKEEQAYLLRKAVEPPVPLDEEVMPLAELVSRVALFEENYDRPPRRGVRVLKRKKDKTWEKSIRFDEISEELTLAREMKSWLDRWRMTLRGEFVDTSKEVTDDDVILLRRIGLSRPKV